MRGLAGKEGVVVGRDDSRGRSRAGEEAGGATGRGGLRAWGLPALSEAGLASCAHPPLFFVGTVFCMHFVAV